MTTKAMFTDFIVIGSGLAGLTSSLILSKYGKVLLVTKGKLSDGATNWAQGGIACVVEEDDSWQKHYQDTLIAGSFHNDKKAVEFLVKNAPTAIDWLASQGVPFERRNGKFRVGREGGHSYNRIIHATDFTGKVIEMTMVANAKNNQNIEIWENAFAKRLLVEEGKCIGLEIITYDDARMTSSSPSPKRRRNYFLSLKERTKVRSFPSSINCFAQATILATGGLGQIYQWTTNPYVATGDGIAMAYRAGAKLKDLEFIQFHPTALKHGQSPLFLISEAVRGEGGYLVRRKASKIQSFKEDVKPERFMGEYDKRMELAPRDIVARAIFAEQKKGYEIFLEIRHKGEKFLKARFPNIYKKLKIRGFDLAKDLIPVTPAAHYSCGGVKTDLYGRTNIKNLFAFGEVAYTGVHGANRLASNSLLEAVVFPLQLSKAIHIPSPMIRIIRPNERWQTEYVIPSKVEGSLAYASDRADKLRDSSSRGDLVTRNDSLRKNLQHLMWQKVGIVRSFKEPKEAKKQIDEWEKEVADYQGYVIEILELKNMILVAKLVVQGALKRKKSLGAHFVIPDN